LVYIPWEKCTKRDAEASGAKIEKILKPDAQGHIRETSTSQPPRADAGTDLFLRFALQRRGLALEIANVCSYNVHELWVQVLLDALLQQAPPGYVKVTVNQLRLADEKAWQLIGRACRNGFRWTIGEEPPFEKALKLTMYDPAVRLFLMPLAPTPASTSSSSSGNSAFNASATRSQRRKDNKKRAAEVKQYDPPRPAKQPKGRGKDRGNHGNLDGKCKQTSSGEPICFNFNLRGCPNASAGAKCPRGWHLCAEPGCQKSHPLSEHRS
jgi:hypothetical protein